MLSIVDQEMPDLGFGDVTAERWVSQLPETLADVCGVISGVLLVRDENLYLPLQHLWGVLHHRQRKGNLFRRS